MYRVLILPIALEELSKLDKSIAQRISNKLTWLSEHLETVAPLPLKGSFSGFYKLKIGDWRIIYDVNHDERAIYVHKVGHRREIYQ